MRADNFRAIVRWDTFGGVVIIVLCVSWIVLCVSWAGFVAAPTALAQPDKKVNSVISSTSFETKGGWSTGYVLAKGHGPGVVVGPGRGNPNVFAQQFSAQPGDEYKVIARAASLVAAGAIATIQVNWLDATGAFITVDQRPFHVTPTAIIVDAKLVAPPRAAIGVIYVVPGDEASAVRYTEMSLVRLPDSAVILSKSKGTNHLRPRRQQAMSSRPNFITTAPDFASQGGWSAGYALAKGHGPGVVVGPGQQNPNVFAQPFTVQPGEQFKIVARASSASKEDAVARLQVNWADKNSHFLTVSQRDFPVGPQAIQFEFFVTAPPGATVGGLFVVPGGVGDAVRYTEIGVVRLNPLTDFLHYRFFGIEGTILAPFLLFLIAIVVTRSCFYKRYVKVCVILRAVFDDEELPRRLRVRWLFPVVALMLSAVPFIFLGVVYESTFLDGQWHQVTAESAMRWDKPSPDLGGDPMHNFGIEQPIKPELSPTFWVGRMSGPAHRIQLEGAFQALVFFVLLYNLCRRAGVGRNDAAAVSLIAVWYLCVPLLSGGVLTSDATLGLLWQEGALATLVAFSFFICIGDARVARLTWLLSTIGIALVVAWLFLSFSELIAYFTFATVGLFAGALAASETRWETLWKFAASSAVLASLFLLGLPRFVLNLYEYSPQLQYKTIGSPTLQGEIYAASVLMYTPYDKALLLYAFYALAILGAVFAFRSHNRVARRILFGALGLEVSLYAFSALMATIHVGPITFGYVEQTGLWVIALLAAWGAWELVRQGTRLFVGMIQNTRRFILSAGTPQSRDGRQKGLQYSLLFAGVAVLLITLYSADDEIVWWPPSSASQPHRIQSEFLAVKPGGIFKGRGVVLVGMAKHGPISWVGDVFPVLTNDFGGAFHNDLMVDAQAADIPMVNDYGHWISPPMLALLAAAFYDPQDPIDRAAQVPRRFRPNLARLLGVSLAISDQRLPDQTLLYSGTAEGHPIFMQKVADPNLGQYSPTRTVLATNATQILDQLQAADFDGRKLAVVEEPVTAPLVPASHVSVRLMRGPAIRVSAESPGTSLLVLPFDFSYCLRASGAGLDRLMPVNLSQTGLLFHGAASVEIVYRYGLLSGTACRARDLARIKKLGLENAATGRLFRDTRQAARR